MYQTGSKSVPPTPQNMRMMWMVLIGGMVALAFLVEGLLLAQITIVDGAGEGIPMELLRYGLAAVALMTSIGILVARKWWQPDERHDPVLGGDSEQGKKQSQRKFTVWLVSIAMVDSIALYGLVLFFLSGQRMDFYLFAVPALLLMLVLRPADGARRI